MRNLFLALVLLGCHPDLKPTPAPGPVTSMCAAMCRQIGPVSEGGLGCPEGEPTYNDDLPGPVGVPNESCAAFCESQEKSGVAGVQSCSEIENARQNCGS